MHVNALAASGFKTKIIVDETDCTKTKKMVRRAQPAAELRTATCDISDKRLVQKLIDSTPPAYGRIDILINNAAKFASLDRKPFKKISLTKWDKVISVNLRGVFILSRAASPIMKSQKYRKTINIASDTVTKGTINFVHYVPSKGGIFAFSRKIAKELKKFGTCVNSITPGADVYLHYDA